MEGFAVSWTRNGTRISIQPLFMTLKRALALSQPSQDTLQITHFLVTNDRRGMHLAQKWNSSCHSILLALQLEQTWLLRKYLQTRGSEESVARLLQKATMTSCCVSLVSLSFSFWLHWVLISCSMQVARGILVPWPGIKPTSSALEDGFLTSGPPGKSLTSLTG